jgi:hypothetical protein
MDIKQTCVDLRDGMVRELGYLTGRYDLPRPLFQAVRDHTMCSIQRLDNMYRLAKSLEQKGLAGAVVECGVWKGGCSGVAAAVVRDAGYKRRIHLFDSFEGLPEPSAEDGAEAAAYSDGRSGGQLKTTGKCIGTQGEVEQLLFGKLGLDRSKVAIHAGWFQDTLPKVHDEIGAIALLRLDGDWYDSTKVCLKFLYPHVVSGGYVILDDYGTWAGCRKAFEEYRTAEKLGTLPLERIDQTGVYFSKP